MDNTMYIALARQSQLFNQMGAVANNVANITTDGYQQERVYFTDYMMQAGRDREMKFSYDMGTFRNDMQGPLKPTGRSLDVAIEGNGFFSVETPEGIRFSRNGSFVVDTVGQLTTEAGDLVLGEGDAPIVFLETDTQILFAENGTISARNQTGGIEARGNLSVSVFDPQAKLTREGDRLLNAGAALPVIGEPVVDYRIVQGMVEGSNVNPTAEMTEMIQVNRAVGSVAKIMSDLHELQRNTVSRLARQQ